jgi:hypothetical protein
VVVGHRLEDDVLSGRALEELVGPRSGDRLVVQLEGGGLARVGVGAALDGHAGRAVAQPLQEAVAGLAQVPDDLVVAHDLQPLDAVAQRLRDTGDRTGGLDEVPVGVLHVGGRELTVVVVELDPLLQGHPELRSVLQLPILGEHGAPGAGLGIRADEVLVHRLELELVLRLHVPVRVHRLLRGRRDGEDESFHFAGLATTPAVVIGAAASGQAQRERGAESQSNPGGTMAVAHGFLLPVGASLPRHTDET